MDKKAQAATLPMNTTVQLVIKALVIVIVIGIIIWLFVKGKSLVGGI